MRLSKKPLYPYQPWQIVEEKFKVETNHLNETVFSLGNGFMGLRGTLEEDYTGPLNTTTSGVYINGVYGVEEIDYVEEIPELPKKNQVIVNLADWTSINLLINGQKFDMLTGSISNYRRILDLKNGLLERELIWTSPDGEKVQLQIKRFLSFAVENLGFIHYTLIPLNFSGQVKISTAIKGDVQNSFHFANKREIETIDAGFVDSQGFVLQKTESTDFTILTATCNQFVATNNTDIRKLRFIERECVLEDYLLQVKQDEKYTLTRSAFLDYYQPDNKNNDELLKEKALLMLKEGNSRGWEYYLAKQKSYLNSFWKDADISIVGDQDLQQAFRFNIFHLLQATGRGGSKSIPAKGLTGEHYEGHYFWDTEAYMLPFYLYTRPEIARDLLIYRYYILDQSRANARKMKLKGALYSWRTINGEESSGYFMGSTVQYHINADIAYAIYQYYYATGDSDFLFNYGVEILIETARMWASLGTYIALRGNLFCFNEVCGPDEYKPGVDNNCYTNYMAKYNLEITLNAINLMKGKAPALWSKLKEKIDFKTKEIAEFQQIAGDIYLPYNKELGLYPQDDSFIYKDPIDIDTIPEDELPLVNNWHPLIIWRYQVIKQADVILLMLFMGDKFTLEEKILNYDYYEPKTIHDSSLSPAIYSIIGSEIGYLTHAYKYFLQTALIDLEDLNRNTYQGVHTACMGSTWMVLIMGFAGMRNYHGLLHFNPYLPDSWQGFTFKIKFWNRQLKVKISRDYVIYRLIKGEKLKILHYDKEITVTGEEKKLELNDKSLL